MIKNRISILVKVNHLKEIFLKKFAAVSLISLLSLTPFGSQAETVCATTQTECPSGKVNLQKQLLTSSALASEEACAATAADARVRCGYGPVIIETYSTDGAADINRIIANQVDSVTPISIIMSVINTFNLD